MKNDGWIEWKWTEEKPYPETLDTKVWVRFADGLRGENEEDEPSLVAYWHHETPVFSNWYQDGSGASIVAYKVAE